MTAPLSSGSQGYQTLPIEQRQARTAQAMQDHIAEEQAVALVYNCMSHAVMMATPLDLEDFALGFSLTEGVIQSKQEVYECLLRPHALGTELKLEIIPPRFAALQSQRRNLTGRTGCGLCGAESLQQAVRPVRSVTPAALPSDEAIQTAMAQFPTQQVLQALTGSLHGAAWCDRDGRVLLVREDVGRHNALDKLIGALHRQAIKTHEGFVLVSSRASYEMVQKVCQVNIPTLIAISAPTTLAITLAQQAGLNLVGFARAGHYNVYTQQEL